MQRISVAPMMGWTDRHARYFLRKISPGVRLYTEMVNTGALLQGDSDYHLAYHPSEHPLALQLGGSEPDELAKCAVMAEQYGYDEVNLNVGCPSDRVQSGRFGACLMLEPQRVADCVDAMQQVVSIPVTVKCRTGIDRQDKLAPLLDFIGLLGQAGCRHFIIHARNAWLQGLSPKQNRDVPPLRYDDVYKVKQTFADFFIAINGGIKTLTEVQLHLLAVDSVMIGREAYHNPWLLAEIDRNMPDNTGQQKYLACSVNIQREQVVQEMVEYARQQLKQGQRLHSITRHMLGLYAGQRGAKAWRRYLSEHSQKADADETVLLKAVENVEARLSGN